MIGTCVIAVARRAAWLALAVGLWLAPLTAGALELQCTVRPTTGLWWALQLMAGDATAQSRAMHDRWRQAGLAQPDDAAWLARFAAVRARWRGRDPSWAPAVNRFVPPLPPARAQRELQFASVFVGATDWDDLQRRVASLPDPADAQELAGVIQHFAGPGQRMYASATHVAAFCQQWETYAKHTQLRAFVEGVARWMATDADAVVRLQVVPAAADDRLTARFLGDDLLLEVRPADHPRHRGDEVVHELVHWLQDRAGTEREPALLQAFFASNHPASARVLGSWHEALATAIGQGLWQQHVAPDEYARSLERALGWYTEPAVDALAKALAPALANAIGEAGGYADWLAVAVRVGGQIAPARGALLVRYAAGAHGAGPDLWQPMDEVLPARAVWRTALAELGTLAERYQALTVLAAVRPRDVSVLRQTASGLGLQSGAFRAIARGQPGVWQQQRSGGARLLIATGRNHSQLARVLRWLALQSEVTDGFTPLGPDPAP